MSSNPSIIYFEYKKDKKSRLESKVTLFLWNNQFYTEEISLPWKIPTRFVKDDTLIKKSFENLKQKYGDKVRLIPIKDGKWKLYHLELPFLTKKELKQELSKDFLINYSINDYLRMKLNFPFSQYKDGKIIQPDLETILSAPAVAMDFETHNWKYIRNISENKDLLEEENIADNNKNNSWLNEKGKQKE